MTNTREMIVKFLTSDPAIATVNFSFMGGKYKISTHDYRQTLAHAFANKDTLGIGDNIDAGARASYNSMFDTMDLPDDFSFSNKMDLSTLLHECTHTLFDIRNIGKHSRYEEEAVAYVVQAFYANYYKFPIFFNTAGKAGADLSTYMFRVAGELQSPVCWGPCSPLASNEKALVDAISRIPIYRDKSPTNESNGTKRSLFVNCIRAFRPT